MFLTALGAIFSSTRIWLYAGIALAVAGALGYVMYLRMEASGARAALSSAQATISVSNAALATDSATISSLQKQSADAQDALMQSAGAQASIAGTLSRAEAAVSHVSSPKACQTLDPRDLITIDGVRWLFAPDANPPNASH